MKLEEYITFYTELKGSILRVTFDNKPVNIQDLTMIAELDRLAIALEQDREIKVVIFDSAHPNIFVAHADVNFLKDMSTTAVSRDEVELLELQRVLQRISALPQVTIAQIAGYARGGGHEFALACDLRYADRNRAIFMQMEVGMGILPCGGGTSRMARSVGLAKALEIILTAEDITATQAEEWGLINKALDSEDLANHVDHIASRIASFPSHSIEACKRMVHRSIDLPINEALREEAYWLYQATSQTPAIKRFSYAADTKFQESMDNQHDFANLLLALQEIK